MLDFTSALYLGLRHPHRSLRPWEQFTSGVPAALASPPAARTVARMLAELQGYERATLGPSTLHLFWDLFGLLGGDDVSIYMDSGVYPILRWGVERAAARGARVQNFDHHDAEALRQLLKRDAARGARRVLVTDGFCPACGKAAPITQYLEIIRAADGCMVIDDTQALGILGYAPERRAPYGKGGGGIMRYLDTSGPDVVAITSLSKAFGVPVASLSGSRKVVRWFEAASDTRVHCSPPSIAVVHAARHALALNHQRGDSLRLKLAQLVCQFRKRLKETGLSTIGELFPVQTLAEVSGDAARTVYEGLQRAGIKAILRAGNNGGGARISFIITALHSPNEIDRVAEAIAQVTQEKRHSKNFRRKSHELQA
jgi:8-amino-7-oxononanoate synthase